MKVYRVEQVAEILQASPRHVQRLIRLGRLQATAIGAGKTNNYRISRADLEAFIDERIHPSNSGGG